MANIASKITLKTDGLKQSLKDAEQLIGPLRTLNETLSKLLAVQAENYQASGQATSALHAERKAQKDLAQQVQETLKTREAAAEVHEDSTARTLINYDLLKKAGKELLQFGKESLKAYQELEKQAGESGTTALELEQTLKGTQLLIGRIIADTSADIFAAWSSGGLDAQAVVKGIGTTVNAVASLIRGSVDSLQAIINGALTGLFSGLGWIGEKLGASGIAGQLKDIGSVFQSSLNDNLAAVQANYQKMLAAGAQTQKQLVAIKALQDKAAKSPANTQKSAQKATTAQTPADNLTAQERAYTAFYAKLEQLATDHAARMAALGDTSTAAGGALAAQYEQQYEQAQIAAKRAYYQQIGDIQSQVILDIAEKQAAIDAEHLAKIREQNQAIQEQEIDWQQVADDMTDTLKNGAMDTLTSGIGDFFGTMVDGTKSAREAMYDMFQSMAKNIFQLGIQNLLKTAGELIMNVGNSAAQTPVVGPIVAAAAMATFGGITAGLMAKYKPKETAVQYANGGYISDGMVRGGIAGRDSVEALLMPGERVLSREEAAEYQKNSAKSSPNINIVINIKSDLTTPAGIDKMTRETLIPAIKRAVQQGYSLA